MSLNRDFIGRSYESSPPFEIGRELIRHFAHGIGDRFQSWGELTFRLNALAGGSAPIDARAVAAKASEHLRRNDRKTRKAEHGPQAEKCLKQLVGITTTILAGGGLLFEPRPGHFTHRSARATPADDVRGPQHATVFVRTHDLSCNVHYAIVDRDNQFQLLRRFEVTAPRSHAIASTPRAAPRLNTPRHDGEWEAVHWFDPAKWPDDFALESVAHTALAGAVELLMSIIQAGGESPH